MTTNQHKDRPRRARGFTLVEMMVAAVALCIMSAGVVGVSVHTRKSMEVNGTLLRSHSAGKRCLEKLQRQLRAGSLSSMKSTPPGFQEPMSLETLSDYVAAGGAVGDIDNLVFQSYTVDPDAPDGVPTLSDPFGLDIVPSTSDATNGVDDDGDGFTDELRLVLTQPDGQVVTLCDNVASFSCQLTGRTLTLQLTLQARSPEGTLFSYPTSLSVEIRND